MNETLPHRAQHFDEEAAALHFPNRLLGNAMFLLRLEKRTGVRIVRYWLAPSKTGQQWQDIPANRLCDCQGWFVGNPEVITKRLSSAQETEHCRRKAITRSPGLASWF